jgi:hypothetical protein
MLELLTCPAAALLQNVSAHQRRLIFLQEDQDKPQYHCCFIAAHSTEAPIRLGQAENRGQRPDAACDQRAVPL